MIPTRPTPALFVIGCVSALLACTPGGSTPKLSLGRPVLAEIGVPSAAKIDRLELTARLPSIPAWTLRLEKDGTGIWRVVSRSDLPASGTDLADGKLVDHLLEILGSFVTEGTSENGTDAVFGLNPFRFEARITGGGTTKILRLGDLVGKTGIYFRVGEDAKETWVGRGALIPFLATADTPESFVSKSPYVASPGGIRGIQLEKLIGDGQGRWSFSRTGDGWSIGERTLGAEKSGRIERVVRQRVDRLALETESPDFARPDWRLRIDTEAGEETLELVFVLNDVFGRNPRRSERGLVLYPEFAGALRAFTQARFTPVKSGTK